MTSIVEPASTQQPELSQEPKGTTEANGLPSPESTPVVEDGRVAADRQRREAIAKEDEAGVRGANEQASPAANAANEQTPPAAASKAPTPDNTSVKKKSAAPKTPRKLRADVQRKLVEQVAALDESKHYEILGVKEGDSKETIRREYMRRAQLTDPRTFKHAKAKEANKKIKHAAKELEQVLEYRDEDVQLGDGDTIMGDQPEPQPQTDERKTSIMQQYTNATPVLQALYENPGSPQVTALLAEINARLSLPEDPFTDNERAEIDIAGLTAAFTQAKPFVDRLRKNRIDVDALNAIAELNRDVIGKIRQNHPWYPETWIIQPPAQADSLAVVPGRTRKGEPILGCRELSEGKYQFYVQTTVNSLPYCETRSANEVGVAVAKAYTEWDQKRVVGENARKYRKKDLNDLGELLHIACKPVHTRIVPRIVPKNGRGRPRRPPADIFAWFRNEVTTMTFSDWAGMLGKGEADYQANVYYEDRGLTPPWDIAPKRTLKEVVEEEDPPNKTASPIVNGNAGPTIADLMLKIQIMMAKIDEQAKQIDEQGKKLDEQASLLLEVQGDQMA